MNDKIKKYYETYDYSSRTPVNINLDDLTEREKELLIKSDTFCILPWIHLHAWPTGEADPCCLALDTLPVGNLRQESMEEIWNNDKMKAMRHNMLNNKSCGECTKC